MTAPEYAWGDFDRCFCGSVLASGGTANERVITSRFLKPPACPAR
jgi:hypothetical protein